MPGLAPTMDTTMIPSTIRTFVGTTTDGPRAARSRCDETMGAIKDYILCERLQPGDLLPTETMLCEHIGASRSSVREAVRKLEALNIVSVRHGKGTFVGDLSLVPMVETLAFRSIISADKNLEDLKGVVTMRRVLDMGCADDVVTALRGTDQPFLADLARQMTDSAAKDESFPEQDIAFHTGLMQALHNTVAEELMRCLWLVQMTVLPQLDSASITEKLSQTALVHERMLRTAIDGDLDGYRQAVIDHYTPIQSLLDDAIWKGPAVTK